VALTPWALPTAVAAVAVWPLRVAIRRAGDEVDGLRSSVAGLRNLRAAAVVVGTESAALRRSVENPPCG
jgi:hypothetical protein